MDAYNPPNLSGEYTGDMTDADLADELGLPRDDDVSDYADAFNEHASSAFWAEIERLCRHRLADDEPQGDDVMVFGHPMTYWYRGDV